MLDGPKCSIWRPLPVRYLLIPPAAALASSDNKYPAIKPTA